MFQNELHLRNVGATSPGGLLELVESFPWILEGLKLFGPDLHTVGSSLNLTLHLFLRLYFVSLQTVRGKEIQVVSLKGFLHAQCS